MLSILFQGLAWSHLQFQAPCLDQGVVSGHENLVSEHQVQEFLDVCKKCIQQNPFYSCEMCHTYNGEATEHFGNALFSFMLQFCAKQFNIIFFLLTLILHVFHILPPRRASKHLHRIGMKTLRYLQLYFRMIPVMLSFAMQSKFLLKL